MKLTTLLSLAVFVALVACAPKPAAPPAANVAGNAAAADGIGDPAKACASYGLAPGSQSYQDCVSSLTDANTADAGDPAAMRARMDADAAKQRAEMQAQMDQQRAQMKQQMDAASNTAGASGAGCVTHTDANNNVSTVCP